MKPLHDCNAVISGASVGLGFAIAKAFIQQGANVTICARNLEQLLHAQSQLQAIAENSLVVIVQADMSQEDDVSRLMTIALDKMGCVTTLVANAAIHGPKGSVEDVSWQEWSHTIDVNLKGTVLQCRAILPHFKHQNHGKIILLSGGGATAPRPYLSAYAASKAAIVRFGETLACEVSNCNITVNSIAPGALNTRLLDDLLAAGPEKIGMHVYEEALKQKQHGGSPMTLATNLCAFLASSRSVGITGKLISALWDLWQDWPNHLKQLHQSDLYTLRRIVPEHSFGI